MSARLLVTPARWAAAAAALGAPSHVLTLRSPSAEPPRLDLEALGDRLDLVFHDIAEARPGLTPPDESAIAQILKFAQAWPGERPLLVSCYAGVSRSTAAAYLIACLRQGPGHEEPLARTLRAVSPSATPNALMVALGDSALHREGRMHAAVEAIGRGAEAFEGEPFAWDLESGAGQRLALAPSSTAASHACSTAPSTSPV